MRVLLGTGVLSWNRKERIEDRYGAVFLLATLTSSSPLPLAGAEHEEEFGNLLAIVRETRKSDHIGDLFRGFSPSTPKKGEEILLGTGCLFFDGGEEGGNFPAVGVSPEDLRPTDWLNPKALYRCHSQTVELYFVMEDKP